MELKSNREMTWKKLYYILSIILLDIFVIIIFCCLGYGQSAEAPFFSKQSGFYEDNFYLEIKTHSGGEIYYTLDGSIPDEMSLHYDNPILIEDASLHENSYSMRTDVSAGFMTDLIEYYQTNDADPCYQAPDFLIDKCTVVRAVTIQDDGSASEISNATYFVGRKNTYGCNVIYVISDPANLFDRESGIYVTGKVFEDYIDGDTEKAVNWRFWDANYRQRGREWEREAVFQFFSAGGDFISAKQGGMRVHGGVSRGTIPRGLNLYARKDYDGRNRFDINFWGNNYNPQRITLASGGNDLITQFCDYMMSQKCNDLNISTMEFSPYVMFLDGEYWGYYWLTEKYDEEYLNYHFNVNKEDVAIIKNGGVETGNEDDYTLYSQMKEFIKNNDMSLQKNYKEACEMIDIESYIDYYAVMAYIARRADWPSGNFALWRTREENSSRFSDGKWRWLLYDCNSTSMSSAEHDTLNYIISVDDVFASLWENEDFRKTFKERLVYIADNCFDADEMNEFIETYNEKMIPVLAKSWERFYGKDNTKINEYNERMEEIQSFFNDRKKVIESWNIE